ncbi:BLUF domain-containing protein [Amaricoccus macauensis]|uniref:BLUF domain-containing protein n=1 Tax=Amaricoccus macauensis TaxID=57001 RepID=UPI003C7A111A
MASTLGRDTVLLRLSFTSQVKGNVPGAALARVERQSSAHNRDNDLTGELHLLNGQFRQDIEGPRSLLLPLAARILADPRHESIEIESFGPIEERRFRNWRTFGFNGCAGRNRNMRGRTGNVFEMRPGAGTRQGGHRTRTGPAILFRL